MPGGFACLLSLALLSPPQQPTQASFPEVDFAKRFAGYEACYLLREEGTGRTVRYNAKQCAERYPPCSTFKIPNALIGLETGVLKDETTLFKWDGKSRGRPAWDRDQTLKSAFQVSAFWYFQRVAAGVGRQRMQTALDRIGYGNRDISGGQMQFWLMSTLRISANEQLAFIERLYRNKLPFSRRTLGIVQHIMVADEGPGWTLRGKTGSGNYPNGSSIGWYVGYLTRNGRRYAFATNLRGKGASGFKARDINRTILTDLGLLTE